MLEERREAEREKEAEEKGRWRGKKVPELEVPWRQGRRLARGLTYRPDPGRRRGRHLFPASLQGARVERQENRQV